MRLVCIRQTKGRAPEIATLFSTYALRCRQWIPLETIEPKSRGTQKEYTAPAVWNESSTRRVVLHETGKEWSSVEFSGKLRKWKDDPSIKTVCFFVGGPYGIDPEVRKSAHETWSLSRATFPSDIAWLVLGEQLYRGLSVLWQTPYHHE